MATNGNSVNITLTASDKASGVFKGLTGLIEGATLRANLLSEALSYGVGGAVSFITDKFKEAANIQLNVLNSAASYSAITNRSLEDAQKIIRSARAELAQSAATLPGQTDDYTEAFDKLLTSAVRAKTAINGVYDEKGAVQGTIKLAENVGYLQSSIANLPTGNATQFFSKFLTTGQIDRQLEFFNKANGLSQSIQRAVELTGKTGSELSAKERFDIVERETSRYVTKELKDKSRNTIKGLLTGFTETLFSADTGLLGLNRSLDGVLGGSQTVLNSFNKLLISIFGDNGLFVEAGEILTKLGFDKNTPLNALRGGIENFNNFVISITGLLTYLDSSNNAEQLKSKFSKLFNFTDLGKNLGGLFNNGITYLQKLDLKPLVDILSHQLTSKFNELAIFFETINYSNIAKLVTNSLVTLYQGIGDFLISTDWGSRLSEIVNKAFKALGKLDWGNIFSNLGVVLANVLNTVLKFLEKLDTGAIFDTVISIIGGMFTGLGVFLANIDWTSVIEVFKKAFTAPIDILGKKIGNVIEEITYFLDNFINKLTGRDDQSAKNQRVAEIQADPNLDNLQKARKIREIDRPTVSSKLDNYSNNVTGNYANGLNVGSLMSAISREQKAAPAGSSIVIANSTEAILNRQQQAQLASSIGRGGGLSIGSIVIHTAATNGQEIADTVMQHIADQYNRYNQNNLATAI
jgi:hypothetical protein